MNGRYLLGSLVLTGALVTGSAAMAWDQYPFDQYLQRSDTIFPGAGDDQQANTVTHMIDPWPRYVGNRNIPGNGERMSDAVERYRDNKQLRNAPRPIEPLLDVDSATGGGGNGGNGGGNGGGR